MQNLPCRILCVDDNEQMRSTLKTGLEALGFEVVTACHGIDAYGLFEDHQGAFDAILTDHQMPHMGGMELTHLIRNSGFSGRIIVMSSTITNSLKAIYQPFGVLHFLTKPFAISLLGALLVTETCGALQSGFPG